VRQSNQFSVQVHKPMFKFLFALILVGGAVTALDPDCNRDAMQLIQSRGFNAEAHWVTTSDTYILELFRIPRPGAPVAFLQHGLLDSADTWLVNSRAESLAYMLADAGFDVWMGNSRGNKYSRNSTKLSPNWPFDATFWDFTWDNMAQNDLPAQIDYVLQNTGRSKLVYIGHSQGTTQAFANFARSDWSLASKVDIFIGLAPVAYIGHTSSVFVKALATLDVDKIVQFLGVHEFLGTSALLQWLLPTICDATPGICDSLIYLLAGFNPPNLNSSRLEIYVAHFPSGTSVKDMVQWGQGVRTGRYAMYDYGLIGNELHYHSSTSPSYNLTAIAAPPVALFHGGDDPLADTNDVNILISSLPPSSLVYKSLLPGYDHLDFVWGQTANVDVYNEVVSLAIQYSAD